MFCIRAPEAIVQSFAYYQHLIVTAEASSGAVCVISPNEPAKAGDLGDLQCTRGDPPSNFRMTASTSGDVD
jgi:hypothetical protein